MSESLSRFEPVEQLAEEFLARYRRGERPSLSEYTRKYPELAELIREYFPGMVVMEELGSVGGTKSKPRARTISEGGSIPEQLGEYRILREIGRGGMGIVYEAVQESLGRHVALKVLPFHGLLNPTHLERFRREARAVARLHHTNIVPVFGVGEHEGIHYYAMQFIHGQGLNEVLQEVKRLRAHTADRETREHGDKEKEEPGLLPHPLAASVAETLVSGQLDNPADKRVGSQPSGQGKEPVRPGTQHSRPGYQDVSTTDREPRTRDSSGQSSLTTQADAQYFRSVAQIGLQVAEALDYAHVEGVLHRDIKPSNLLVDTNGRVWVTDFGLAKADETEELTEPGDIVGTVCYMAPERFGGKADIKSDVYGLGITLYELATLQPAFADSQRARLIEKVSYEEPRRPRKLDANIPRDLETIVLKAIAKDPSARYATARALAEDLRRFLGDRPIQARRASLRERSWRWCRRNPVLAMTAGLAGSALAAVAGLSIALAIHQYQAAGQLRGEQQQTAKALEAAREQREQAQKQRDLAERLSTTLALDGALNLCERGDVALGVLGLARALEFAPAKETDLQHAIRANLAAWENELPRVKGVLQHQDGVTAVAWSPDGKTVLTGGWEEYARLWSVDTGTLVSPPLRHGVRLGDVAFSPDGRRALTGGEGRARVWDIATGRPLGRPIESRGAIWAATFSPDGRMVVAGGSDGKVRRWDATTGEFLGELLSHGPIIWTLAFSPDGRSLATGGDDRMVRIWDAATGNPRGRPLPHPGIISAAAFSHDGSRLVTGSSDGAARLWDVSTCKLLGLPIQQGGTVRAVAFSGDDRMVLTASSDGTGRLWDAATGKPLGLPLRHRGQLHAAAFSPDGNTVLTGGIENVARLWDVSRVRRTRPTFTHGPWVRSVAFSPCGRYLLTGSEEGTARLWDLRTQQMMGKPFSHASGVRSVAFSPDGSSFLTGSFDGTAQRWETATGRPLGPPIRHGSPVWSVAFGPDGRSFLIGDHGGTVQRWDSATGNVLGPPLHHPDKVNGLACSPDGRTIATACQDGAARLWNAGKGQALDTILPHQAAVWAVAFSPDGKTVLTGSWDGTARLWDAATGQPKGRSFPHQAKIEAVAFSPDGQTILTGGFDHAGRLWDVSTGKPVGPPLVQDELVLAVAFHPNGKLVATAGGDGTAQLWEVPPPTEGPVEDLVLRSRLRTGMQLDHEGTATVLPAEAWYRLRWRWELPLYSLQIALCPFHPGPYYQRGRGYARFNRWQEALSDFNRVVALKPDHAQAYYQRALIHASQGRLGEAEADLSKATELGGNCVQAWIDLGNAYQQLRQWDKAVADYSKAIELDPSHVIARNNRAYAYSLVGRWNEAAGDLAPGGIESQSIDAGDFQSAWFDVACLRLLQGDSQGYRFLCGQLLERISRTKESFTGIHACLASRTVLLNLDADTDLGRSLRWAEAAISSNPKNPYHLHILALAHYRAGQFNLAIQRGGESLRTNPRWGGTVLNWLLLAMAHQRLGQHEKARQWTKQIVQWQGGIAGEKQQADVPYPPQMPLPDWLEFQVLSREAAGLLQQKDPPRAKAQGRQISQAAR
jgi:WD40 repeat protein/serine/threonine protein kinase/tetratricopeptide (TPR) repeat protein